MGIEEKFWYNPNAVYAYCMYRSDESGEFTGVIHAKNINDAAKHAWKIINMTYPRQVQIVSTETTEESIIATVRHGKVLVQPT